MLGRNLKYITGQYIESVALSDGVESGMLASFRVSQPGFYLVLVKYTLRISITAVSYARGGIKIKKNSSTVVVGGDGLENHWDGGATTTGDIDCTTSKHTFMYMEAGDTIDITGTITRRGGTVTAYTIFQIYFSVFRVE